MRGGETNRPTTPSEDVLLKRQYDFRCTHPCSRRAATNQTWFSALLGAVGVADASEGRPGPMGGRLTLSGAPKGEEVHPSPQVPDRVVLFLLLLLHPDLPSPLLEWTGEAVRGPRPRLACGVSVRRGRRRRKTSRSPPSTTRRIPRTCPTRGAPAGPDRPCRRSRTGGGRG